MENLQYYIALIVVIALGAFIVKKVTGCVIRIIITIIALALLTGILYQLGLLQV